MATIKIDRGTTVPITVNYTVDGIATDITGSTILFTVKSVEYDSDATDTTAVITKTVTSHTDPTAGVSTITLLPADTRSLTPGDYYYSIKIDIDSDDLVVYELSEGTFTIDGDPTNRIA